MVLTCRGKIDTSDYYQHMHSLCPASSKGSFAVLLTRPKRDVCALTAAKGVSGSGASIVAAYS